MTITSNSGSEVSNIGRRLGSSALTYRPIIGSLIIVLVATYLISNIRSANGVMSKDAVMNAFMGCFFIVFALPKLIDLSGFAEAFGKYDLISKRHSRYAKAYPFIELGIGLILLSNFPIDSMSVSLTLDIIIALLSATGLTGVIVSLGKKEKLNCACLGTAFKFPLSKVAIIENSSMLIMAVGMLFLFRDSASMTMVSLTHFRVMS